jgi:hypothetical protein
MRLLRAEGERHLVEGWKARQLAGNDDVGVKTKEPGSLKRASNRFLLSCLNNDCFASLTRVLLRLVQHIAFRPPHTKRRISGRRYVNLVLGRKGYRFGVTRNNGALFDEAVFYKFQPYESFVASQENGLIGTAFPFEAEGDRIEERDERRNEQPT